MKKLLLLSILLLANIAYSQTSGLVYKSQMSFDYPEDSFSPYLCSVDSSGNLWVVSTNIASANAIHGLFKAAPGESVLHLVKEFTLRDSVRDVTGLTTIGDDVFVLTRKSAPSSDPAPEYYPYSQLFYFPNGDTAGYVRFGQPYYKNYGSWYSGLDASNDKYLYFGQSYLMTIGTIDGNKASESYGTTVAFALADWSTPLEPGGDLTGPNYADLIRDIAVDKLGDYTDSTAILFTSRNSSIDPGASQKGGIAKWTKGKSYDPSGYRAERLTDINGFLSFSTSVPYGISINPGDGTLFVCGTDSSRKWVKGFQISGNFAVQTDELPSSTSKDIKDPKGAPFEAPGDIAFNREGTIAYVTDEGTKKVYKFVSSANGVEDGEKSVLNSFELKQNYPNPFNPSTNISFKLPVSSNLKAVVYDIYGQQVSVIADGFYNLGNHVIRFDGSKCSSGVYMCQVKAGDNSKTIKMVLMK